MNLIDSNEVVELYMPANTHAVVKKSFVTYGDTKLLFESVDY